jgi:hypothetical protein
MIPMTAEINNVASDALRFITITHASIFTVLIGLIILEYRRALKRGAKSSNAIKHEMMLLLSYLVSICFMIQAVARQLHHEFSWYVTPIVLLCLLLGDFSLYYLMLHRADNKE